MNGEHRIGIFAGLSNSPFKTLSYEKPDVPTAKDIKPGTELFLDYGAEFFHAHPQNQSTDLSGNVPQPEPQVLSLSFYQDKPPTPMKKDKAKVNKNGKGRQSTGRIKLTDLDVTLDQIGEDGSAYERSSSELDEA